jgi:hypothetical protein
MICVALCKFEVMEVIQTEVSETRMKMIWVLYLWLVIFFSERQRTTSMTL